MGVWAQVERLIPVWAAGFDEPVRVTYDVGLGREFKGEELRADDPLGSVDEAQEAAGLGGWRLLRARNKWQTPEECAHHPSPGTFPVVVTDAADWGGWRTPAAEYDRDPPRIERQARLIALAPHLLKLAQELDTLMSEAGDDAPAALRRLGQTAHALVGKVETPTV